MITSLLFQQKSALLGLICIPSSTPIDITHGYPSLLTMAPLKIIIVGAGIGGLAAAIGLARNGHQVTVYERLSSTTEIGYAFRITPNSDRCLKYLGIDTIAGGAVAANLSRMFNAQGQVVFNFSENSDAEKAKRGTSVFAYRVLSWVNV